LRKRDWKILLQIGKEIRVEAGDFFILLLNLFNKDDKSSAPAVTLSNECVNNIQS